MLPGEELERVFEYEPLGALLRGGTCFKVILCSGLMRHVRVFAAKLDQDQSAERFEGLPLERHFGIGLWG